MTKIFFSYKFDDHDIASQVTDLLRSPSGGNVQIYLASRSGTFGRDWDDEIKRELDESDILFLLFTGPSKDDWDWPLYEVGLFSGKQDDPAVICFHTTDEPPNPIKSKRHVKVSNPESIKLFLKAFFVDGIKKGIQGFNPQIEDIKSNKYAGKNELDEIATDIETIFRSSKLEEKTVQYYKHLFIHISDPSIYLQDRDVDELKAQVGKSVVDSNLGEETFRLFNLARMGDSDNVTWDDVRRNVYGQMDETAWVDELETQLFAVCRRQYPRTLKYTFRSLNSNHIYRPIIGRMTRYTDGSITILVSFEQQYSEGPIPQGIDKVTGTLLSVVNMGARTKYEVIERFANRYHFGTKKTLRESVQMLLTSLNNIVEESDREGFLVPDNVIHCFREKAVQEKVRALYDRWGVLYGAFVSEADKGTVDDEKYVQFLGELGKLNTEFMQVATLEYHNKVVGNQG